MPHRNIKKSPDGFTTKEPQFPDIVRTIGQALNKVSKALTVEVEPNTYVLSCIKGKGKDKEFDFLSLEGDINQIHHKLSFNTQGNQVVGTYATFNVDVSPYELELETHFYNKIRKENLKASQRFFAHSVKNIPADLLEELEEDGNFRLYFE